MFITDKADFLEIAKEGKVAPLIRCFSSFSEKPATVFSKLQSQPSLISSKRTTSEKCLLESAGGLSKLTKYSFICLNPQAVLRSKNNFNEIVEIAEKGKPCSRSFKGDPFLFLRHLWKKYVPPFSPEFPFPFWGGAVGYLSYDAARYIEELSTTSQDDLFLPDAYFIFPQMVLVFDHHHKNLYGVVNQLIGTSPLRSYKQAAHLLEELENALSHFDGSGESEESCSTSFEESEPTKPGGDIYFHDRSLSSTMDRSQFEQVVRRIKDYIRAGDVYQVNISQRLQSPFSGDPFKLYLKLCQINPSPFAAYMDMGNFKLLCSSPERLIHLKGSEAQTRPIAGTRRRGENFPEDDQLSGELLLDPKERAEHVMLVDLERNDLGRVCDYGTVRVDELMTIEKYSHVIHIVSNVRGKLRSSEDQFDLIQAMFPGGTITGCPKVRSMEIIEELEPVRRGPYTGSIGYFGYNGNMDLNIAIRTFVLKNQTAYVQVGAGIVADSDPSREYFEALSKAEALLSSLGIKVGGVKWEKLPM